MAEAPCFGIDDGYCGLRIRRGVPGPAAVGPISHPPLGSKTSSDRPVYRAGVEIVEPARVEERAEIPYLGIRVVTPFRGMLAVRDRLLTEVRAGIKEAGIMPVGYGFLRLYVIDMQGSMDLEAGYLTAEPIKMEHPEIRTGSMVAGRYATMKYRDHARRANQALQDWVRDNGLVLDRRTVSDGDAFECRYEAFWTDPTVEPRKTRWTVELSMLLAS